MAKLSKDEFVNLLKKSRVVGSEKIEQALAEVNSDDSTAIATHLLRKKLLTRWQAKYLMSGRSRLQIGSYQLLERIQRDELGDRFLAIHKQLGRKVDIQVLPAELTKDKRRCDAFIQKASLASKLDHPNLIHVYDIDQEGGRYFLVTEHIQGVALKDASLDEISCRKLGRLIQKTVAGIQFAHDNNVTHGDLTANDIVLTDDDSVKIRNISVSPIRAGSTENGTEAEDYQAVANIGIATLKQISADPDDQDVLEQALLNVLDGSTDSVNRANEDMTLWLGDSEELIEEADLIEADEPIGDFLESVAAIDQGGFDAPVASVLAAKPTAVAKSLNQERPDEEHDDGDDEFEYEEPGFIGRLANENPIALIATGLVLALMLSGGVGYAVWAMMSGDTGAQVAQNENTTNQISSTNVSTNEQSATSKKVITKKPTNDPDTTVQPKGILDKEPVAGQPDFSDTEAMKNMIDNLVPAANAPVSTNKPKPKNKSNNKPQNKTADAPPAAAAAVAAQPKPVPVKTDVSDIAQDVANKEETPAPAATPPPTQETTADAASQIKPDVAESKAAQPAPTKTLPKTEPKAAPKIDPAANPFDKFPRATELPAIEDSSEFKIHKLLIANRFLMGAEIHSDPGISKSRTLFDLERSTDDKQKWMVNVKRKPKDKGTPVATLRRSETELLFQWLPDAAKTKNADALRNCVVNLKLPDTSHWLSLRKPVTTEPFVLTAESLYQEKEVEISSLPSLDSIGIQILKPQVKGLDLSLNPAIIDFQQGLPGRLLLNRSDANAFVWFQSAVEIRNNMKIRAGIVVLINGQVTPLKNIKDLEAVVVGLKQISDAAARDANIAKTAKPAGVKADELKKIRDEYNKTAASASKTHAKGQAYLTTVKALLDHPISLRTEAKMGAHTIDLVRMVPASKK